VDLVAKILKCFLTAGSCFETPVYSVALSVAISHSIALRGHAVGSTVDSRLSARGLTALRLNRGNVFLKKKFYFP
jgi:hypothetical protein